MIQMKRIYEPESPDDGYRVLVDRLWPRGVKKTEAHLDAWDKELAPSTELRKWYGHDPEKWPEFQKRYRQEQQQPESQQILQDLAGRARHGTVTLLYAARAGQISEAAVIRDVLDAMLGQPARTEG